MSFPAHSSLHTRPELEQCWRLRLDESVEHYRAAAECYRELRIQQGTSTEPDAALTAAAQLQAQALAECMRVLQIFSDYVMFGKTTEDRSLPDSSGGKARELIHDLNS